MNYRPIYKYQNNLYKYDKIFKTLDVAKNKALFIQFSFENYFHFQHEAKLIAF